MNIGDQASNVQMAELTRYIKFLPSGRTCKAETNETILEAALRSGLSPEYGCSNGNCGSCKARLKSGNIERVRHHDFPLTNAEKIDGTFLMCSHRALGDVEIEADATRSPSDISVQEVETKVKVVEYLDSQVLRLELQTPRSRRLRFVAGQTATLSVNGGLQITLAIASCPCDDRNLSFHIPHIPDDAFSELLFSGGLRPKDSVLLKGPHTGSFFLDDRDDRDTLILCWHTGFAPTISLVEQLISLENEKDVHLFRFSPTPSKQYLGNLCRSWADAFDNIRFTLAEDRLTLLSTRMACEQAFAGIAEQYPNLSNLNIYVVGPPNFAEAAKRVFVRSDEHNGHFRSLIEWAGLFNQTEQQ